MVGENGTPETPDWKYPGSATNGTTGLPETRPLAPRMRQDELEAPPNCILGEN